jgi:hypothetical protein
MTTTFTNCTVSSNGPHYWITASSSGTSSSPFAVVPFSGSLSVTSDDWTHDLSLDAAEIWVSDGKEKTIHLPDGTIIEVKADGSFEIFDKDAKVIYRANRIREFNPFINASDKIEEFIRFCGAHRVRQNEMIDLPLKHFIAWLVVEAARADQEPTPSVPLIPDLRKQTSPQCVCCGRFIPRRFKQSGVEFCKPKCFEVHYQRATA